MPSLLEKAQANAKKLLTPKSRATAVELAKYRNYLKVESHRLRIEHRAGGKGATITGARAAVLDLVVQYLYREILQVNPRPENDKSQIALVAYGGYGRGVLNPYSDLDLMILHNHANLSQRRDQPWLVDFCQSFFLSLTDIRIRILPVTRSVADCVKVANEDMQSKTALIETRLVIGEQSLFDQMTRTLLLKCVSRHEKSYIAARLEDQHARREKFGNSPYMQEPNIKNGCGGLRDYQNLLWMAFFKKRCQSMEELLEHQIIDSEEYRKLTAAYDYLLRVRTELHYLAGRPEETLRRSFQPRVAFHLGFTDRSPSRRLEAFMQEVYTHLRNVYLLSRTLEQRMALFPQSNRLGKLSLFLKLQKPILLDGFEFKNGQIVQANPRAFKEQPRRLMRVFRHAQQRGLKFHPDLAYAVRSQLSLADRAFLHDTNVRETFVEILNQKGNVGGTMRAMHEIGLLGKYLPEFGRLTGKVQHEFYHVYTADEHTIVCLEQLDAIWEAKEPYHAGYRKILERLNRPYLLYLALILHDTGKSLPNCDDHSVGGAKIAKRVGARLGLSTGDVQTLRLLIAEHLTMAQISQRRDIDDPQVIQSFAELVQESEHADLLTLMTFSDSVATSEEMWNGFKDALLRTLHQRTYEQLTGDTTQRIVESKLRHHLKRQVEPKLPPAIHADEVKAHFDNLPDRYFHTNEPEDIANDLERGHRFMARQVRLTENPLNPIIAWSQKRNRGYTALHIVTWDFPRVFADLCGALAASGINILSAQIFSRKDGIIFDTFSVADAKTGSLVDRKRRKAFEELIPEVFMKKIDLDQLVDEAPKIPRLYQSLENEKIQTRIEFDNETSERHTILDIDTEDHVGLLYFIATALIELELNLSIAKVSTERGAAIDSFYIVDEFNEKVRDGAVQNKIRKRLMKAIKRVVKAAELP